MFSDPYHPANYVCSDCGASLCKLWVESKTQVLRCARCVEKWVREHADRMQHTQIEKKVLSTFTIQSDGLSYNPLQRMHLYVVEEHHPAVPAVNGGYVSILYKSGDPDRRFFGREDITRAMQWMQLPIS